MDQLIYTSAPRLLDAGKSGFGTIARGRDIPKALVNYLERISTFDRAAGVDSLLYYTVFSAAGLRFHIFSRVQDCGADYTGRTNHVAHHFISEEGSAEYSSLLAGTPAGAMLALQSQWCKRWDDPPCWLDSVPLPAALPKGEKFTWTRMTDSQENAGWLCAKEYHQGATLVFDRELSAEQALGLLHDAFLRRPDHGWGTGFCTAKVTNISSSLTPFVCLDARQVEAGISPGAGSRRLAVGAPMTPPPPSVFPDPKEEPVTQPQTGSPEPGGMVVEDIAENALVTVIPTAPSAPLQTSASDAPIRSPFGAPVRQGGVQTPAPGRSSRKPAVSTPNKSIAVLAVLLVCVVAFFCKISSDKEKTLQQAEEYAVQVDAAVELYRKTGCPLAEVECGKISTENLKKAVEQRDASLCEKLRLELENGWSLFVDALVNQGEKKKNELRKYELLHFEAVMKEAADAVKASKKDIRTCKDKLTDYCNKVNRAEKAVKMLQHIKQLEPLPMELPGEMAEHAIQNNWQKLKEGESPREFEDFMAHFEQKLNGNLDQFKSFEGVDDQNTLGKVFRDKIREAINNRRLKEARDMIEKSREDWNKKKNELEKKAEECKADQNLIAALKNCDYVNATVYNELENKVNEIMNSKSEQASRPAENPPPPTPTPESNVSPVSGGTPDSKAEKGENVTAFSAEKVVVWFWTKVEGIKMPQRVDGKTASEVINMIRNNKETIKEKRVLLVATFPKGFKNYLCESCRKINGNQEIRKVEVEDVELNGKNECNYGGEKGWEIEFAELEESIERCVNIKITSMSYELEVLRVQLDWKKPNLKEGVDKEEREWKVAQRRAESRLKDKRDAEKKEEEKKKQEEAAKAQPSTQQGASSEGKNSKASNAKKNKKK